MSNRLAALASYHYARYQFEREAATLIQRLKRHYPVSPRQIVARTVARQNHGVTFALNLYLGQIAANSETMPKSAVIRESMSLIAKWREALHVDC